MRVSGPRGSGVGRVRGRAEAGPWGADHPGFEATLGSGSLWPCIMVGMHEPGQRISYSEHAW